MTKTGDERKPSIIGIPLTCGRTFAAKSPAARRAAPGRPSRL
jgi:hypothetical protein